LSLNGKKYKAIPEATLVKQTKTAYVLKVLPGTYVFKTDY